MANKQAIPATNTNVNRGLVSSQMQEANLRSMWRAPDFSGVLNQVSVEMKQFADEEKKAAYARFDIEAANAQTEQLEAIRTAKSAGEIPEIQKNFQNSLANSFKDQDYGKQWLAEKGSIFFALNNKDVTRAALVNQKERAFVSMNKTLDMYADDIAKSAPDKAKVLMGDMNRFIDNSNILSPEEIQKTKDNATKLALQKLASTSPNTAVSLLKDENFTRGLGIDAKSQIDDIIKKQFAEIKFQEQVKIFNNERNLSETLDNMAPDEALRLLEENEDNVSKKYFKAKQKALLAANGITADTRADEAFEITQQIASLPKEADAIEDYYKQSNDILTLIEEKYASGRLSSADRRKFVTALYKNQGANLESLKGSEAGSQWMFWGYSYKDAAEDISKNFTGAVGNKIMLEYFRKINDGDEYDTDQKKAILQGIINKAKADDLALPHFANLAEAESAFKSGKIKKGDNIYINGRKAQI